MVEIEVAEVRGYCPVYRIGDKIVVDDSEIVLEKTDALCTHALSSVIVTDGLVLMSGFGVA